MHLPALYVIVISNLMDPDLKLDVNQPITVLNSFITVKYVAYICKRIGMYAFMRAYIYLCVYFTVHVVFFHTLTDTLKQTDTHLVGVCALMKCGFYPENNH